MSDAMDKHNCMDYFEIGGGCSVCNKSDRETTRSVRDGWQSANEAPYDTMCLFYTIDGNVVQGFIYDGDAKDFGYTHYMPLPTPPQQKGD